MRQLMVYIVFWFTVAKTDKRLLLNNPEELHSIVNRLELEFQQLESQQTSCQNDVSMLTSQLQSAQQDLLGMNSQIKALQQENILLKSSGTTYTIWGKTTCPADNNTDLIYSGVTAGTHFNANGGGVNYLCLPHDPQPITGPSNVCSSCVNHLYGSEYDFNYGQIMKNDDVPCAVCHSKSSSSVLLVPAHNICPTGWIEEYNGLLCSHKDGGSSSDFVCLAGNPEYIEGTRSQIDGGKLFNPVKTVCGSLPCPPYKNNQYVSCVICTK